MITGRQLKRGIRITINTRSNHYVWRVAGLDGLDVIVIADWDIARMEIWTLQEIREWVRDGIVEVEGVVTTKPIAVQEAA